MRKRAAGTLGEPPLPDPQPPSSVLRFTAVPADAGKRLDLLLHECLPGFSRSRIQDWIRAGRVQVNGVKARASYLVRAGDAIDAEPADPPPLHAAPEEIPLSILYEDADLVAIDKPAGMVVHAGAGVHSGTLVNALLHRFQELSGVGGALRPGIVHRLDRFTSGVLLVAKNDAAHQRLAAQFSGRQVEKIYLALVHGEVKQEHGRIERPIARDPVHRTRMTARLEDGRAAWSEYRVLRRFPASHCWKSASAPGARTRFACIFPASAIPWPATRCMARRPAWRAGLLWAATSCTHTGFAFTIPLRAPKLCSLLRCRPSWRIGCPGT